MDLPFNKIIIDSRHAAAGNSSNFQISLPETLTLPQHAVCYVCDLQITNTFSSTDPSKNTFYWIENELNQYVLNRVFLTRKQYTPDTLATELQTRMNETSIFRPGPGYVVTFEEDLGVLKIERTSLLDKTFFLVNDDLLQQLYPPLVTMQFYDVSNGIQTWTLNRSDPKSAMSLFGLGPRSSENATLNELVILGNALGNTHYTGALDLRANHCIYLHSPHANKLQSTGPSRQ